MSNPKIDTVSFFTNCYENDWKRILMGDRLAKMIKGFNYDFEERVIVINNVSDRKLVEGYAQKMVASGVIDSYHFEEDISEKVLKYFDIKRSSFHYDFHDGYWYSIAPLASVFFCKSKYLLSLTCDCSMIEGSADWIGPAIEKFKANEDVLIANPVWDNDVDMARAESFKEDEKWFYSGSISDQVFLVETERLKGNIYKHKHGTSEKHPVYGGNSFERRMTSYLQKLNLKRITAKDAAYNHEKLLNHDYVPGKKSFSKKARYLAGRIKRKLRILFSN